MLKIKEAIAIKILNLTVRHKLLCEHQNLVAGYSKESFTYARLELSKAWIELKIAILKALLGESK